MKIKLIYIFLFILLIVVAVFGYKYKKSNQIQKPTPNPVAEAKIHYHAGFIVFDNGKKIDFSDTKYMQIKPCLVNGQEEKITSADSQIEKAHLHDNVGDVVHVEEDGARWGDLFTNIKYDLDYSKVTAYINGQKIEDLKSTPINKDDSLVIFVGKVNQKLLSQTLTKEYIEEKGKSSSSCSD